MDLLLTKVYLLAHNSNDNFQANEIIASGDGLSIFIIFGLV
jgi:hypothetical protein